MLIHYSLPYLSVMVARYIRWRDRMADPESDTYIILSLSSARTGEMLASSDALSVKELVCIMQF